MIHYHSESILHEYTTWLSSTQKIYILDLNHLIEWILSFGLRIDLFY